MIKEKEAKKKRNQKKRGGTSTQDQVYLVETNDCLKQKKSRLDALKFAMILVFALADWILFQRGS